MGRDNSPQIRQQAQLARKKASRASYDRVLIVSEGSKTEPMYFCEIRSAKRLGTMHVQVQPSALGTEPSQVVQYAKELFENGDPNKKIQARAFDKVFAVFDRDEHRTYFNALDQAAALNGKLRNDQKELIEFRAIASIPSFELWLLLHFEDIQHPLHRDDVMARLSNYILGYAKGAGGSFALTEKLLSVASARAISLAERSNAYCDSEPYTDIYDLVRLLINLK